MSTSDDKMQEGGSDELLAAARRLPQRVSPARDLWPAIADAIATDQAEATRTGRARWQHWLAYAAAVVLLVGGSSSITWLVMSEKAPQYAATPAGPLYVQPVSASFGGQYELGPEFMAARDGLASQLDAKLRRLSPRARAEVERNMVEIRASIQQINHVLADEPDNALLQELLLAAYREEIDTMRRVDGLLSTVMRREDI